MKPDPKQSYSNHRRLYPSHHFVQTPVTVIVFLAALVYAVLSIANGEFSITVLLLLALSFATAFVTHLSRRNALVVQDRAIQTAEQLRHYMLTGKPLDARLTRRQVIALRFASDEEFPELAAKAAETGMPPVEIKRSIQRWRPDEHRV